MKKLNITAFVIITAAVLALFITAVFFQFFTYGEDGKIYGEWRAGESLMYLGTARIISLISGIAVVLAVILFLISHEKSTRKQNVMEIIFIALGAFTIVGSLGSFYPCTDMMKMNDRPMRCYWTMKSLLGLAGAISISGVLMLLFNKSKDIMKGLNFAVIMFSCLFILTPLKMTEGFCSSMSGSHPCLEQFRPFTLMMSCFIIILSVINAFLLYKNTKRKA
ncbi:MAG: DUF4418 family protein [Treponema sp.]|nr:DUF4418 family protein [Treponema sp.]